jgi:arylsulfatase B
MPKIRYSKLAILTAISFLFVLPGKLQAQNPNILLVIADDVGTDALNGFTTQTLKPITPTLDSLRAKGISFTNVWATPVCSSTRASIMSGKHGSKTGVFGVPGNLDTSHISVLRKLETETNNAYAKAVVGKWHISMPINLNHPAMHGADFYTGFMDGFPDDYLAWEQTTNGVTQTNTDYVSSVLTDSAIAWTQKQTKPWLLWLAHAAPHTPFHVPPSPMYSIANPVNNTRKFIAMIESVDYEINRLLASMSATERANTLVIFIGDNGTTGSVLRDYPTGHGKGTVYEGGVRVPMIVAGKGVSRAGVQEKAMIQVLDIYATVLELVGADLDGGLYNSLSFKHLLTGENGDSRRYNYTEFKDGTDYSWAIRNSQYKLIQLADGSEEFYDLLVDSFEFNPIVINTLTTEQQAVKADLFQEAKTVQTSWSCRDFIKNGDETGIDCGGSQCSPCSMSIRDLDDTKIVIYPNPSSGIVMINSQEIILAIKLYNAEGKLIKNVTNINKTQYQFELEKNASVIWCEVQAASGVSRKKIVRL